MDQDQIPSIGGYLPLIVLTDSMSTGIQSGDLVIYHTIEAEDITKGDVIAFYDPAGSGDSIVTHRVIQVTTKDGELAFQTKGDASDTADEALVPADHIVGIYCSKIAGAGNVALFFQTTKGLILCVIVPLFLLVGYDMIRRQMYERRRRAEADALRAELETLRSEQAEK
jgi:signal peptidase